MGHHHRTEGDIDVATAHHGAGWRDWDTGGGGSGVTAPTRFTSYVSNYLSSDAHNVSTTSEEGGLMLT